MLFLISISISVIIICGYCLLSVYYVLRNVATNINVDSGGTRDAQDEAHREQHAAQGLLSVADLLNGWNIYIYIYIITITITII